MGLSLSMKTNKNIVFIITAFIALVFGGIVNGAEVSAQDVKDLDSLDSVVAEIKKVREVLESPEDQKMKAQKLENIRGTLNSLRNNSPFLRNLSGMEDLQKSIGQISKNPPMRELTSPEVARQEDAIRQMIEKVRARSEAQDSLYPMYGAKESVPGSTTSQELEKQFNDRIKKVSDSIIKKRPR